MRDASIQLGEYLAECAGRRFDWNTWNCTHFAAGWVDRMTGINPLAGLPAVFSRSSAHRVQRRLAATLADAVTLRLGFEQCHPAYANVGDLVLVDGRALGICNGVQAAVLTPHAGVGFVPLFGATHAWRVAR